MDIIIFKLAILLIPGFVTLHFIKTFSGIPLSERRSLSTYDLMLVLLFSLFSAAIFDLAVIVFNIDCKFSMFEWITRFQEDVDNPFTVSIFMILFAINLGIGMFLSWCSLHQCFYKIFKKLKISHTYGREDLWANFTTAQAGGKWVIVRDFSNNFIYSGSIYMASETFQKRELVLLYVEVYTLDEKRELLFSADSVYLPLLDNKFSIEYGTENKKIIENEETKKTVSVNIPDSINTAKSQKVRRMPISSTLGRVDFEGGRSIYGKDLSKLDTEMLVTGLINDNDPPIGPRPVVLDNKIKTTNLNISEGKSDKI
jgi:hypothetical protein